MNRFSEWWISDEQSFSPMYLLDKISSWRESVEFAEKLMHATWVDDRLPIIK